MVWKIPRATWWLCRKVKNNLQNIFFFISHCHVSLASYDEQRKIFEHPSYLCQLKSKFRTNVLKLIAGAKWRRRRKILTPTFHFQILESFIDVFNKNSQILMENLENRVNSDSFNIFPYLSECTLDIICGKQPIIPGGTKVRKAAHCTIHSEQKIVWKDVQSSSHECWNINLLFWPALKHQSCLTVWVWMILWVIVRQIIKHA